MLKKNKAILIACSLVLSLSVLMSSTNAYADIRSDFQQQYPENQNLASKQIADRFASIDSTYAPGVLLSPSDADFVKKYSQRTDDGATAEALQLGNNVTQINSGYGTTVMLSGQVWFRNNNNFTGTYGGYLNAQRMYGAVPNSMKVGIRCTVYGIVGQNGIYIVYNGELNATGYNPSF